MAEFRTLHVKIWQDEWFCNLRPDGKLLFMYLVTNRAASVAGIYKLPEKFIVFETGIRLARVQMLMAEFGAADKVYYQDGIVWVRNLRRYQTFDGKASENVNKRIAKDLAEIPDGALKERYQAFYAGEIDPAQPIGYPSDTPGIPPAEKDKETEQDTDKEKTTSGAAAPNVPPEVTQLIQVFEQASGISLQPAPKEKKNQPAYYKMFNKLWGNPLKEMFRIANGSAPDILRASVKHLRKDGITFASPNSVLKTFTSMAGERAAPAKAERFIDYN